MRKLFQKIDRLRLGGYAVLSVAKNSPYAACNGQRFKIHSMGTPDIKCRITLYIENQLVDFNIDQVI
ncbi:hypothetical protein ACS5PU_16655 [Pedobacter sp. GSP4]|uniref:hypothetical protein n=1 Tax=Pedobacter sp. GSP4 TaxID=3453716 RepID=UPI003EECD2C9